MSSALFFFNDTATTEIYTLSLHDALPILPHRLLARPPGEDKDDGALPRARRTGRVGTPALRLPVSARRRSHPAQDRKSTRLNSSHGYISYAVFCLQKKNRHEYEPSRAAAA